MISYLDEIVGYYMFDINLDIFNETSRKLFAVSFEFGKVCL